MKKKIYLVVFILIIFNVFLFVSPTNKYITDMYNDLNQIFKNSIANLNNINANFTNRNILEQQLEEVQLENEMLTEENKELTLENDSLKTENDELKSSLDINQDNQNVVIANASYKKINTPFNIFVIDKGKNDNIKKNQIVTYKNQMIGYVSEVYDEKAEVTLLKNDNIKFNIPIKIKTKTGYVDGVIESYSSLENKIIVTTLIDGEEILQGDRVYTNGYEKNQQEDIYVGEITKVEGEGLKKEYYISPVESSIDYVEVVTNED